MSASRHLSLLIAAAAAVSLAAQYRVTASLPGGNASVAWQLAGYFTVLTNVLILAGFAAQGFGRDMPARRAAGLVLAILVVAIVYHTLLAGLWAPLGLAWWADQGLHSVVPALAVLWWLAFGPRAIGLRDLPFWLIWPVSYAAYALVRGTLTGFWPYPFLDADALGWVRVAGNVAGLSVGFAVLGAGFIALARVSR